MSLDWHFWAFVLLALVLLIQASASLPMARPKWRPPPPADGLSPLTCRTEYFTFYETKLVRSERVVCNEEASKDKGEAEGSVGRNAASKSATINSQKKQGSPAPPSASAKGGAAKKESGHQEPRHIVAGGQADDLPPPSSSASVPEEDFEAEAEDGRKNPCEKLVSILPKEFGRRVPITVCDDGEMYVGIDIDNAVDVTGRR